MYGYGEDEEETTRNPNVKWVLIIGLILLGWYFFRAKTDIVDGLFALDFATFGMILLIGFGKLSDSDFKNRTRKFISNPLHTTITNDPARRIGAYAIFRAGGIDTWMVKVHGNDGSIIVPINCLTNVGECVVANTRMVKVAPNDLPDAVREELEKMNYPTPYYYGIPDASQLLNIPEAEEMLTEVRSLNRENQMLKKRNRELTTERESYMEHHKRMADMEGKPKRSLKDIILG